MARFDYINFADPEDFQEEGSSSEHTNVTKSGQEGIGGLITQDAEESYQRASSNNIAHIPKNNIGSKKGSKGGNQKRRIRSLPQIGSIADINRNASVTNDDTGSVQTGKDD
jgi:hypothetical protein